ncbi:hypothetical protein [Sandarakinorhabdus sp. DWP1-3-1]|uniref:hypothetical protein n=1 Tax=Sandarakinorhabdus sp. DWP1-3-1 TaxID=2804627 RepID=UPI003CF3E13C
MLDVYLFGLGLEIGRGLSFVRLTAGDPSKPRWQAGWDNPHAILPGGFYAGRNG